MPAYSLAPRTHGGLALRLPPSALDSDWTDAVAGKMRLWVFLQAVPDFPWWCHHGWACTGLCVQCLKTLERISSNPWAVPAVKPFCH